MLGLKPLLLSLQLEQQPSHGLPEPRNLHRFEQVILDPEGESGLGVAEVIIAADDEDLDVGEP